MSHKFHRILDHAGVSVAQFLPLAFGQGHTLLTEADVLVALRHADVPYAKQLKRARRAFQERRRTAGERAAAVDDAQLTIAPVPGASPGHSRSPGEGSS